MEQVNNIKAKNPTALVDVYVELFDLVRDSLNSAINKERIEAMMERLINEFQQNPHNELLLYAYSISKDNYIIAHITNGVILTVGFGVSLGLSQDDLKSLGICAFCHDFGMLEYTPLFQKGQELSEEEESMIRKHPFKSVEVFRNIFPQKILDAIVDIHEHVDGTGYPQTKEGSQISPLAKMVAVCDTFVALTHPRNFRKEFSPYEAIKLIIKLKDKVFDGRVVKRFVDFLSIYPIGSIVYMNTGETSLVIGSNRGLPTKSIVRVLLTPKKEIEPSEKTIDLKQDEMVYIAGYADLKEEKEILHFLKPRGDINL